MRRYIACSFFTVLLGSTTTHLAFAESTNTDVIPNFSQGKFYAGIGENSSQISNTQTMSVNQVITSTSLLNGSFASTSLAGGSTPYNNSTTVFSPQVQLGYIKAFDNTDYLWGTKLAYQHVGSTITQNTIKVTSAATKNDAASVAAFSGSVTSNVGSSQTSLSNEVFLTPFLGYALNNHSYCYFGAGPALFDAQTDEYAVYAARTGDNVSGAPNYSDSQWIWGAAAEVGVDYFFSSGWFLDFNATYAVTQHYTSSFDVNSTVINGGSNRAINNTGSFDVYQHNTVQTIGLSINKLF